MDSMPIFQVAYLSFATDHFDPGQDISSILTKAKDNNSEKNISGMLLFKGGVFLQLLEGSKEDVELIYGKIASDPRHENLHLLIKQFERERIFADWTMAYKTMDQLDLDLVNTVLPWSKMLEETKQGVAQPKEKILEIFKKFRYQLGGD